MLSSFFVGIKNPDNSTHYEQFLKEVKCDFPLRPEGRSLQVDVKGVLADEFYIDEELVKDYVEKIKNEGVENMPPMLISDNYEIIDGIHRLNALLDSGFDSFFVLCGKRSFFKRNA